MKAPTCSNPTDQIAAGIAGTGTFLSPPPMALAVAAAGLGRPPGNRIRRGLHRSVRHPMDTRTPY